MHNKYNELDVIANIKQLSSKNKRAAAQKYKEGGGEAASSANLVLAEKYNDSLLFSKLLQESWPGLDTGEFPKLSEKHQEDAVLNSVVDLVTSFHYRILLGKSSSKTTVFVDDDGKPVQSSSEGIKGWVSMGEVWDKLFAVIQANDKLADAFRLYKINPTPETWSAFQNVCEVENSVTIKMPNRGEKTGEIYEANIKISEVLTAMTRGLGAHSMAKLVLGEGDDHRNNYGLGLPDDSPGYDDTEYQGEVCKIDHDYQARRLIALMLGSLNASKYKECRAIITPQVIDDLASNYKDVPEIRYSGFKASSDGNIKFQKMRSQDTLLITRFAGSAYNVTTGDEALLMQGIALGAKEKVNEDTWNQCMLIALMDVDHVDYQIKSKLRPLLENNSKLESLVRISNLHLKQRVKETRTALLRSPAFIKYLQTPAGQTALTNAGNKLAERGGCKLEDSDFRMEAFNDVITASIKQDNNAPAYQDFSRNIQQEPSHVMHAQAKVRLEKLIGNEDFKNNFEKRLEILINKKKDEINSKEGLDHNGLLRTWFKVNSSVSLYENLYGMDSEFSNRLSQNEKDELLSKNSLGSLMKYMGVIQEKIKKENNKILHNDGLMKKIKEQYIMAAFELQCKPTTEKAHNLSSIIEEIEKKYPLLMRIADQDIQDQIILELYAHAQAIIAVSNDPNELKFSTSRVDAIDSAYPELIRNKVHVIEEKVKLNIKLMNPGEENKLYEQAAEEKRKNLLLPVPLALNGDKPKAHTGKLEQRLAAAMKEYKSDLTQKQSDYLTKKAKKLDAIKTNSLISSPANRVSRNKFKSLIKAIEENKNTSVEKYLSRKKSAIDGAKIKKKNKK